MDLISIAHLEYRLSGGSANASPDASLGGVRSSERILAQSATGLANVTGVSIDYAGGNALGVGTLAFDVSDVTLAWTPNGGTTGTPADVSAGGRFAIFAGANAGFLLVDVVPSALPVGDESDSITIAGIANELFDNVAKAESYAGDSEYRLIYLYNVHDTDPFNDLLAYIASQPGAEAAMAIGFDPVGVGTGRTYSIVGVTRSTATATIEITGHPFQTGDKLTIAGFDQAQYNVAGATLTYVDADHVSYAVSGSPVTPGTGSGTASSGVAQTVANENTAPTAVTFTSPSSTATALSSSTVRAGFAMPLWVRRVVPARNTISNVASKSRLAVQAFF